jgi:hypothetical protein
VSPEPSSAPTFTGWLKAFGRVSCACIWVSTKNRRLSCAEWRMTSRCDQEPSAAGAAAF